MAFLNKVRSLPLPPVRNILNVALQTARQTMPDKPDKSDYEQPQGQGPPPVPPRPQNVRFADQPNGECSNVVENSEQLINDHLRI